MNPQDLNVYIVDNDADLLRLLGNFFVSRGYAVQAFPSGETFLASARLQQPGCVLLDLRMDPGMDGLAVFDALRKCGSPLAVVFMSNFGTVTQAVGAVHNGAFDWIEKPCTTDSLLEKVKAALDKASSAATRAIAKRKGLVQCEKLTPAEMRVAHEVRTGAADRVTAQKMNLSFRTVQSHRAKIYAKLEVSNVSELDRFMRDIDL